MVSLISFGTPTTVNGRTVLAGSQSGLDTTSLIKTLTEVKQKPATDLQTKITLNSNRISALSALKTKTKTMMDALNKLRNPPGFSNISKNVFKARQAFLTTSDGSSASNYVGVSVSNGATLASYDLKISQLATAAKNTSTAFTARNTDIVDGTVGKFTAGTFQINGTNITLTAGASMNDVVSAINAAESTTNVTASVLQISATDYRIVLNQTETGSTNNITIVDGGTGASTIFATPVAGVDAEIDFNGTAITRSSNKISDVVDGVTFSLFQTTDFGGVGTADDQRINIQVDKDSAAVATAMNSFVEGYNDFLNFYAEQNERDEAGNYVETAYLKDDPVLETFYSNITNLVTNVVNTGDEDFDGLSDAGITEIDQTADATTGTLAVANMLSLDINTFTTKLETNFEDVAKIFQFTFSATSEKLQYFKSSNKLDVSQVTFVVNDALAAANRVQVTALKDAAGNSIAVGVPFYVDYETNTGGDISLIKGTGTYLDGLQLVYTGDGTDTITANITQGLADLLYNSADGIYTVAEDAENSSLDQAIANLTSQSDDFQERIDLITQQVTDYRDNLTNKYAALEAAVSAANNILLLLDAQNNAANNRG